nr:hypothetical protein [Tanacetum cinerariifolium]
DRSENTKFPKQPIVKNLPKDGKTNGLLYPVTSNSVSTPQESKSVNNDKAITPGMFRINLDKTSREATKVPNTTRRPQPKSNTKNDRVPSASKSSQTKNKEAEVEEHHRNLLLSKNNKHISSACNNIKTDSQEVISNAKVSVKEIQKKYQPNVSKPKKVGSSESLATPKPRKSRLLLRWSPTGKLFDKEGKIVDSSESKSQSDCSNGDNACTSNIPEPKIKRFPNSTSLLDRLLLRWSPTGKLFDKEGKIVDSSESKSQSDCSNGDNACTSNIPEPKIKRFPNSTTLLDRNLEGVDLLKGDRSTNLYTINLHEMASASPICLMARASSTKSWLWHQRLSHLKFDTINDIAINDLVAGLSKFKYHKEHLCPSCEQGKIKRASHPPKLYKWKAIRFDDCGRLLSLYMGTFSRSKDEAPVVIIKFLKRITVLLHSGLDLTYAPSTIITQQPSESELDLLFEAMYDDYIGGQPSANETLSKTFLR